MRRVSPGVSIIHEGVGGLSPGVSIIHEGVGGGLSPGVSVIHEGVGGCHQVSLSYMRVWGAVTRCLSQT